LKKTERVYREIVLNSLGGRDTVLQRDLASRCGVSIGLVNKVVRKLELARSLEATPRGVRILSPARVLNLWAAQRLISQDIVDSFRFDPISKLATELMPSFIVTGCHAWSILQRSRPAEYSDIYFYTGARREYSSWRARRRIRKTNPNVFALKHDDPHLLQTSSKGLAPVPQIYVDIYSAGGPWAAPFLKDIAEKFPSLGMW